MALKYEIKDTENSFRLNINSYTLIEVMYKTERCTTPVEKEEAKSLIDGFKDRMEFLHPIQGLDEKEYEPSDFIKFLEDLSDDDSMGGDLLKLMMLKAMMDD